MRLVTAGVLAIALLLAGSVSAGAAIFWVNTDSDSIGAANIGRHRAVDVSQQLIGGLALASGVATGPGNELYWTDSLHNRISRARLSYDRRGRLHAHIQRNFITGADDPMGVAVYGGYVYWVNHDVDGSIGRARLDGGDVEQRFIPNAAGERIDDVNEACGLTVTASHIYWADTNQNTIAEADTATGADVSQFIPARSPCGVAVSGSHIYWADNLDRGSIGRANLDGSDPTDDFISGASGPCGLAVAGGWLYWANSGAGTTGSTIARARIGGAGVDERYVTGASSPCGVAVGGPPVPKR